MRDCLDAVARLAHNPNLGAFAEQFAQTGAYHSMVIGDQNPQRLRCSTGEVVDQAFLPIFVTAWVCAESGEMGQTQCEVESR